MSIRILLADDHKLMRQGLSGLLEKQMGMKVIGQAGDGRTAVRLAQELMPDVVIMDISMPDLNGIEATRQVLAIATEIKVIGLSMHSDRRFVVEMLRSGAKGYLLKECAFEELANAVRIVVTNRVYLSPGVADVVVQDYLRHLSSEESLPSNILTVREREVLQLLAEGKTMKEIASRLIVSVKTAETHRRRIMEKLETYTIAGLTKYAIREGITTLES